VTRGVHVGFFDRLDPASDPFGYGMGYITNIIGCHDILRVESTNVLYTSANIDKAGGTTSAVFGKSLYNGNNWVSAGAGFGASSTSTDRPEYDNFVTSDASQDNPLYTLRPFLLERWSDEQITIPDLYLQARRPIISCEETLEALKESSIVCPPIDSQLLMTYTSYLVQTGFLSLA
jgi:thioester reductase-like protein